MFEELVAGLKNMMKSYRRGNGGVYLRDDFDMKILGTAKFEKIRDDSVVETRIIKNIVTQRASVLVQKLLAEHTATRGITHFAIGLGETRENRPVGYDNLNMNGGRKWDCYAPPSSKKEGGRKDPVNGKSCLYDELARKKIDAIHYLTDSNNENSVSSQPTHIAQYKALFLEKEGNGPILEFGLFGGTVFPDNIDYIPSYKTDVYGVLLRDTDGNYIPNDGADRLIDQGDMFTYRTHKLFYKTSSDRLRLTYTVEILMNQAPDEPPAD
jgi:hypothetical protein